MLLFIYQLRDICCNIFPTRSDVNLIVVTQIQLW